MGGQQRAEGVGIQQWYVAGDDHDLAREAVGQRSDGLLDRTTRTGDLVLVDDDRVGHELHDGSGDGIPLVTHDHDDVRRIQLPRGGKNVPDDGHPGEQMEHLGSRRLHARALPGRENDDGEVVVGHVSIRYISRQAETPPRSGSRGSCCLELIRRG